MHTFLPFLSTAKISLFNKFSLSHTHSLTLTLSLGHQQYGTPLSYRDVGQGAGKASLELLSEFSRSLHLQARESGRQTDPPGHVASEPSSPWSQQQQRREGAIHEHQHQHPQQGVLHHSGHSAFASPRRAETPPRDQKEGASDRQRQGSVRLGSLHVLLCNC